MENQCQYQHQFLHWFHISIQQGFEINVIICNHPGHHNEEEQYHTIRPGAIKPIVNIKPRWFLRPKISQFKVVLSIKTT